MGRKGRKNDDDYWDSEAFEQDQQTLQEGAPPPTNKKEESTTPTQSKKGNNSQKDSKESKESNEAPVKQTKGGKKTAPPKGNTPAAKGTKAPPAASTTPSSTSTTASTASTSTSSTPSTAAAATPATTASEDKDNLKDSVESTESTEDGDKKKGKGKKQAGKKKEDEKKKKGGISKKMAEQILKMKEEEERRKKEEEERIKREEEEERRREEEAALQEQIRLQKKEKKKQKMKERQKNAAQKAQQQKLNILREQFQGNVSIPGVLSASSSSVSSTDSTDSKKKPFTKKKRPTKPTDAEESSTATSAATSTSSSQEIPTATETTEATSAAPTTPVAAPPAAESKAETAAEEVDDWEAKDDWESALEEKPEEQKAPSKAATAPSSATAEKEAPTATEPATPPPTPTTTTTPPTTTPPTTTAVAAPQKGRGKSAATEEGSLRSPICCVLGHVDTGKTSLLDKIRRTNVQEGEAGGITQQIGATYFPMEALREQTQKIKEAVHLSVKVPGLLIIDTPGHESFTNLRARGSSLCDIAILVVDLMHALEPQTIESINLLRMRKTPFVVALNKVDRVYGWKATPYAPIKESLAKQEKSVIMEFDKLVKETVSKFAEQSLNATLYYTNKDFKKWISLVPTSAVTGEGIPDLIMLLVQLTQKMMADKLLYLSTLQCTVLEVKVVEGLGTTIDVILVNGVLHEGDTIVLCGLNGAIVTTIRALLTPQPLKEIRVKGAYVHHKEVKAALGVKISAADLDRAVAGSSLLVAGPNDDIEELKAEVMQDLESMRKKVDTGEVGVYVQASTLGSLEALLEFLKQSKIPVSGINIGPINKKDVVRASIMLERKPEYAVILAFDVKESKEARDLADEMGVKIFKANIIYHLFDQFTAYMEQIQSKKKEETSAEAVFPCRLKILPEFIFNKKDPIILGVEVLEGVLKIGTPIAVPSKDFVELGRITSIEINHKGIPEARKGQSVAIKIEQPDPNIPSKVFGRHFDWNDELVSKISRASIDILKANFKKELLKEDIVLLAKLMQVFGIQSARAAKEGKEPEPRRRVPKKKERDPMMPPSDSDEDE